MSYQIIYKTELYHHGIKGQKWGKRNGPPYPLDVEDHSSSEKKAGWRTSLNNSVITTTTTNKSSNDAQNNTKTKKKFKFKLTDKQKKYLKIGAAVAIAGLAVYGAYKYSDKIKEFKKGVEKGIEKGLEKKGIEKAIQKKVSEELKKENKLSQAEEFKKDTLLKINESKMYTSFEDFSKLTGYEFQAIHNYCGSLYDSINKSLREDKFYGQASSITADILKQVFEKVKLQKDVSVFRGIDKEAAIKIFGEDLYNNLYSKSDKSGLIPDLKNTIVLDKGFMSTSLNEDTAKRFTFANKGIIFDIHANKGSKACAVFDISSLKDEKEILFANNSGLKFTGDYKIVDDYIHLIAEIVQ